MSEARDFSLSETSSLWVQALIYNVDTGTYLMDVRFRDIAGRVRCVRIERALMREPFRVVGRLLDAGAKLPVERKAQVEAVHSALHKVAVEQYSITSRGGWHNNSFVTPTRTFGSAARTMKFVGPSSIDPSYGLQGGTFENWRDGLTPACEASSYITFALTVGYAAPLLDIFGEHEARYSICTRHPAAARVSLPESSNPWRAERINRTSPPST